MITARFKRFQESIKFIKRDDRAPLNINYLLAAGSLRLWTWK